MSKNFPRELDKMPIWVISVNTFTGIEYIAETGRTRSMSGAKHMTKKEANAALPDCPKNATIHKDILAQVCL
jgi:hypothetical protein